MIFNQTTDIIYFQRNNDEYMIFFCSYVDSLSLQWKLCEFFKSSSSKVLDIQFGVSPTSLKLVSYAPFVP